MFYVVMGLENAMLMFVWIIGVSTANPPWYHITLPLTVLFLFFSGLGFMWIYYRYFHVRRLKYEAGGRFSSNNSNNVGIDSNMIINNSITPEGVRAKSDDHNGTKKVSTFLPCVKYFH